MCINRTCVVHATALVQIQSDAEAARVHNNYMVYAQQHMP